MEKNNEGASPRKQKRKQLSGAAKLKAAHKHGILLSLTKEQFQTIKQGAALEKLSVNQFLRAYALKAAEALIARSNQASGA